MIRFLRTIRIHRAARLLAKHQAELRRMTALERRNRIARELREYAGLPEHPLFRRVG